MRNLLANFFIISGIILLLVSTYFFWQRNNPNRLAFKNSEKVVLSGNEQNEISKPITLVIEDLGIYLPVIPAANNNGRWATTTDGVSYLSSSVVPGETGNSIFYGHNYKNILGNLRKAEVGQTVKVVFDNGTEKYFKVKYIQTVTPDQIDILANSDDKRITIYTCSGFLDTKRFVVTAILENTE